MCRPDVCRAKSYSQEWLCYLKAFDFEFADFAGGGR